MLPLLLGLAADPLPELQLDYRSKSGLFLSLQQVSLSQGSFIQYYQPGWSRGYYSSNWNDQTVSRDGSSILVRINPADGKVDGTVRVTKTDTGFRAHYRLGWNSDEPCNVEVSFAHLWAPALESGRVFVDGIETRRPSVRLAPGNDPKPRQFGPEGQKFRFDAPLADIEATVAGAKAVLFDARGYDSDFSRNRELFWFGVTDLSTSRGKPAEFDVEWIIRPKLGPGVNKSAVIPAKQSPKTGLLSARESKLPMVPLPKSVTPGKGKKFVWMGFDNVRLNSDWSAPFAFLNSRFELQNYHPKRASQIEVQIHDLKLPAGGYSLKVSGEKLTVVGQDREGVRNGLLRSVGLTTVSNGELTIDPIEIRDWPSNTWRGVHMFVGPQANEFQGRLMRKLLAPMMFNQVVLQCERTKWDSIPGTEVGFSMGKPDLKQLFDQYRAVGVEPTPLIQSFGHMEWLFQNNKNLDLALNPGVPYAVDPRKPRTQKVLGEIWQEAIDLLQPKMLHFGLDEVDMRGWPGDDKLVTDLWRLQVQWLAQLAQSKGKSMMIWGDQMLGPGEAPDAALGDTVEEASARRAAVPPGTWIADWHYINNDNPKIYKSLGLFEKSGFKPVATVWNRPENIKGFFKAAESHGGAVLQSTWAGYESSESNMLRESSQFVSYLLVGEYAWSGRPERVASLPYRPEELFRKLMYGGAVPINPVNGISYQWAPAGEATVGNYSLAFQKPLATYCPLSELGSKLPKEVEVRLNSRSVRHLIFAIGVDSALDESTEVGQLRLNFVDGSSKTVPLRYGEHVRAPRDPRLPMTAPAKNGVSAIDVSLGDRAKRVRSVTLIGSNPSSGLALHAISSW